MRANNSQQKLNPICVVAAGGARYTHLFGRLPPARGKRKLSHTQQRAE